MRLARTSPTIQRGLPTSTQTVKLQVSDGDGGVTVATTVQILSTGTLVVGGVLYIVGGNSTNDIRGDLASANHTISVCATFNSNTPQDVQRVDDH